MSVKEKWMANVPSQFWGQPNLAAIINAFSKQLDELVQVNEDLKFLTTLDQATGQNLDMLGKIVNMSRREAYQLMALETVDQMDDETYRSVLRFKALKNNSDATYADIMKGLYYLWGDVASEITYQENPYKTAQDDADYGGIDNYDEWDRWPARLVINIKDIPSDSADPTIIKPMIIRSGGVRVIFYTNYLDQLVRKNWEHLTALIITAEQNHFYNGDYNYNGRIQYKPDNETFNTYSGKKLNGDPFKYNGEEVYAGFFDEGEPDMADAIWLDQAKKKQLRLRARGFAGNDGEWKITHFAFGTGLGEDGKPYTPTSDMTELKNEVLQVEVMSVVQVDEWTYQYTGVIGDDDCNGMYISEVGLVDNDGMLICIKTFDRKFKQTDTEMVFKINDTADHE